jgi:hypothetical protein
MSSLEEFDYEKSLKNKRLHILPRWLEIIEISGSLILFSSLIIWSVVMFFIVDMNNPNERGVAFFVLPLAFVFGIFAVYKKLEETRLKPIRTGLNKTENHERAIAFMNYQGYKIKREDSDFLIAITDNGFFSWPRQINILFEHGEIYVCVLTLSHKFRVPSFFRAKEITKDLEKFIMTKGGST